MVKSPLVVVKSPLVVVKSLFVFLEGVIAIQKFIPSESPLTGCPQQVALPAYSPETGEKVPSGALLRKPSGALVPGTLKQTAKAPENGWLECCTPEN